MLKHYSFDQLGKADYGWLKANYHFSFANYYDPLKMGFGALRVINDDCIAPHKGFDTHPHQNMEIITYVRSGAVTHQDSKGHQGKTAAGSIQVMSAGSGIFHSEHNVEDEDLILYQIWIEPRVQNIEPRWDSQTIDPNYSSEHLPLLVSGDEKDGVLLINQDVKMYAGLVSKGAELTLAIREGAYLLLSFGSIIVDGVKMAKGDAMAITLQTSIRIQVQEDSELVLLDVPMRF
jgi:redox-sensitive bicupin YhaK (pirin superfamily)